MSIRILVVDDHVLVRRGFCTILQNHDPAWEIYEADNGIQAILTASRIKPDLVLMDYHMPKLDGARATVQIIKENPDTKVIMISSETHADKLADMINAGALGVVSKESDKDELIEAITAVRNGHHHFSFTCRNAPREESVEVLHEQPVCYLRTGKILTEREYEVAKLILEGLSNIDLALQLSLSIKTIEQHKYSIFKKCGVKSSTEFVSAAYRNGWIDP